MADNARHSVALHILLGTLLVILTGLAGAWVYEVHRQNSVAEAKLAAEAKGRRERALMLAVELEGRARELAQLNSELMSARMEVSGIESEMALRAEHLTFMRSAGEQGRTYAAQEEAQLTLLREKLSAARASLAKLEQRYWDLKNEQHRRAAGDAPR